MRDAAPRVPTGPAIDLPGPRLRLLVLLCLAAIWFGGLGSRALVKPDEGRYAEIPREMALSGDWVTPRLNGIKYFEKPPLQYWATAAAYRVFGPSPATARLWTALTGFAGILVVYAAGCTLFGPAAGWLAALALGSNLYYFLLGHINTLDMGLAFTCCVALCAFLVAQRPSATERSRRAWMAAAWFGIACGVLSKGLVAIVLPGLATAIYALIRRDFRLIARMHPLMGMAIVLAVAGPWFVAVSLANPEFAQFFFVHEHFQRFATTVHRRVQPFWFFGPLLLAGTLPWTGAVAGAVARFEKSSEAFSPRGFLIAWSATVLVFFSVSQSKLPAYILPMFPALALLAGARLADATRTLSAAAVEIPAAALAVAFASGAWFVARSGGPGEAQYYVNFSHWLWVAAALTALGALAFRILRRRGRYPGAWTALSLLCAAGIQTGTLGYDALSPVQSAAALVARARGSIDATAPFYSVATYDQTLDFYLGRTVTVVAFQDELEFGLQQQPELWIPTLERFRAVWLAAPRATALMEPSTYESLAKSGLPMREIARDTRRVIVSRQ